MNIETLNENIEISVISPAYKCNECIDELYRRLILSLEKITSSFEIIFINDGSPDNDWKIIKEIALKDKRVKGINLSRNFGQYYAITAGLNYADGKWIVVMDCDLQDRPEEIGTMYNKVLEGFDAVFGRRSQRQDTFLKKLFSKIFYKIFDYFTDGYTDSSVGNFGIMKKDLIVNYLNMKEHNRAFTMFIKWMGFDIGYVDIVHSERYLGKSSYNFKKGLSLAFNHIISQSNKPLKLFVKLGFFIASCSIFYGIYIIFKYFLFDIPPTGWTSTIVSLYFLGGIILMGLGVLGIYIGYIFDEVKNRPLYIVKDVINKDKKHTILNSI